MVAISRGLSLLDVGTLEALFDEVALSYIAGVEAYHLRRALFQVEDELCLRDPNRVINPMAVWSEVVKLHYARWGRRAPEFHAGIVGRSAESSQEAP